MERRWKNERDDLPLAYFFMMKMLVGMRAWNGCAITTYYVTSISMCKSKKKDIIIIKKL